MVNVQSKKKVSVPIFYDEWESAPEELRARVIRNRLDEYIRYAQENVPFYRERLSCCDKEGDYPLQQVPVLKSEELRELLPPKTNKLLTQTTNAYTVFQSGGTTGSPKTTLFTHEELEGLNLPNSRGFFAVGLKPTDRVANCWAVGGLYMTFIHINRMLQQFGCMSFPFSNHTPVEFIHTMTKLFNINCFTGISSVVLNALRGMAPLGKDGIKIDKVYYGGEHLYEADKREIEEAWGAQIIAAPGYGTVDSWYIGYQCLYCPTGVFHAHDDQCYIEIVREETSQHCLPNEIGMVYATAFPRRLTPIVRFRVGDKAMWLDAPCPCGRTTPLFKLLGRGDDVLRIGFDSVDYNFIQQAVSRVPGLSGTVQMEKQRLQGRDKLIIRVETEAFIEERQRLKELLEDEVVGKRPTLKKLINEGQVWPLEVELVNKGSLSRNERTGKLMRVIDVL